MNEFKASVDVVGRFKDEISRGVQRAESTAQRAFKNIERAAKQIAVAGMAASVALGAAVVPAAQFEQGMKNVQSVSGATSQEMIELTKYAREMASQTVFSAGQAAEALYHLGSAGFSAKQQMDALKPTLDLAAATQTNLARTSEVLSAAVSQFGLQASDTTRVANVMAGAIGSSPANMQKLADSFRYAGGIASAFGVSIEQTTAALSLMFKAGATGETAGTALRNFFATVGKQSDDMARRLQAVGLGFDDVNVKVLGFEGVLRNLQQANLDANQILSIFGETGSALIPVIRGGADALNTQLKALDQQSSAADKAAQQNDTLMGSIKLLKSAVEEALIALTGSGVTDWLRATIDRVTALVGWFNNLPAPLKSTTGLVAGLVTVGGTLTAGLIVLAGTIARNITVLKTWSAEMRAASSASGQLSAATATQTGAVGAAGAAAKTSAVSIKGLSAAFSVLFAGAASFSLTKMIMEFTGLDRVLASASEKVLNFAGHLADLAGIARTDFSINLETANMTAAANDVTASIATINDGFDTMIQQAKNSDDVNLDQIFGGVEADRIRTGIEGITVTMGEAVKFARENGIEINASNHEMIKLIAATEQYRLKLEDIRAMRAGQLSFAADMDAPGGAGAFADIVANQPAPEINVGAGIDNDALQDAQNTYRQYLDQLHEMQYANQEITLAEYNAYWQSRLDTMRAGGEAQTVEYLNIQQKIADAEAQAQEQQRAFQQARVEMEYQTGQMSVEAYQTTIQQRLDAMRTAGEAETTEFLNTQQKLIELQQQQVAETQAVEQAKIEAQRALGQISEADYVAYLQRRLDVLRASHEQETVEIIQQQQRIDEMKLQMRISEAEKQNELLLQQAEQQGLQHDQYLQFLQDRLAALQAAGLAETSAWAQIQQEITAIQTAEQQRRIAETQEQNRIIGDLFMSVGKAIGNSVGQGYDSLKQALKQIASAYLDAGQAILLSAKAVAWARQVFGDFTGLLIIGVAFGILQAAKGAIAKMKDGGLVQGPEGGDVIPALLQNQEIVINRNVATRHREPLLAINNGEDPLTAFGIDDMMNQNRFRDGGLVGSSRDFVRTPDRETVSSGRSSDGDRKQVSINLSLSPTVNATDSKSFVDMFGDETTTNRIFRTEEVVKAIQEAIDKGQIKI